MKKAIFISLSTASVLLMGACGSNNSKENAVTEITVSKESETKSEETSSTQTINKEKKEQTSEETSEETSQTIKEQETIETVLENNTPNEQQVQETADPRTTDPNSIYYGATPEELERGKQMEQRAQDDYWENNQNQNESPQQDEEINMDTSTLSGFINTYGMTPSAYKMQFEGMSKEEALASTPNHLKSSGEIQTQNLQ